MTRLRITTWNINSIRLRLDLLARLAEEERPDVVCLQETKVVDGLFPREACTALGFEHSLIHGMKGYNGIAVLSRVPFDGSGTHDWCQRSDCRHGHVRLAVGGRLERIELHNLYVPAGGDVPDPEENPKFAHKLQFLKDQTSWWRERGDPSVPAVLVGDLNIAPLETDVWSHRQLLDVVSHTPVEVEHLAALQRANQWVDAVRHFIPPSERLYTWWSYRNQDWARSDRGRRLDHVWVTPPLVSHLRSAVVLRHARDWPQPSDHVPVTVELEV